MKEIEYFKRNKNEMKWNILRKVKSGKMNSGSCGLCHEKKLAFTICKCGVELLNERSEIITRCMHIRKLTLGLYEPG